MIGRNMPVVMGELARGRAFPDQAVGKAEQ
jgi:hypothetical protein